MITDEIPLSVEYSSTEKGKSVVPTQQSICQWSGISYREDTENAMTQEHIFKAQELCLKCQEEAIVID